jgi:hypothetical protein
MDAKLILPGENQSDFDQLSAGWRADYASSTQAARTLLEEVIINQWLMLRAKRRYTMFDASLGGTDPAGWTEEQHKQLERMTRYRTSAERTFYRSFKALESLKKVSEPQAPAPRNTATSPPPAKKKDKRNALHQWVEVESAGHETITTLSPPNEELLKQAGERKPTPDYVLRRIHFPGRVPEEYAWTGGSENQRALGGHGTQRMTRQIWLEVLEKEKLRTDGHIGPTGHPNLSDEETYR